MIYFLLHRSSDNQWFLVIIYLHRAVFSCGKACKIYEQLDGLLSSSGGNKGEPIVGQTVETEGWETVRKSSSGNWSSSSDCDRFGSCDDMDWCRFLLGSKATSSGIFFHIIQISSSNLFCLYIIVHPM